MPTCTSLHTWRDAPDAHLPSIAGHIVACPRCRGRLLIVIVALAVLPEIDDDSSCDACDADLAAFLDLEQLSGPVEAARTYPHVWWHLLACPDCAEGAAQILASLV